MRVDFGVHQSEGPLAVIDDEDRIVGEVTQTMILKAMSSRS